MTNMALALILSFLALGQTASALQVTPNSPCSSACMDSIDLDASDPTSSTIKGGDITCLNDGYLTSSEGKKFKDCMECLQDSTYSQGSENDQMWFLYNLRYTFDYCVFAYPNASGVDLGPCATTTACGALEAGLTGDELDASEATAYGYCDSEMTGEYYEPCLACVAADHTKSYLANFLIALSAGCIQKPATGEIVGLNDTIFADTEIAVVDAAYTGDDGSDSSGQRRITPQMIIGIIIGIVALLAILVSCLFVRHRKRRTRIAKADEYHPNPPTQGHRPVSSLSFRCQTHLSNPSSPTMFTSPQSTQSPYMDEKSPSSPSSAWGQAYKERDAHLLRALTKPTPAHQKGSLNDPAEDANSPTPPSAVSTKSTSQLLPLRPYNPSEYAFGKPQYQSPISVNSSPSLGGWSPVETRKGPLTWDSYDVPSQKPRDKGKTPELSIYTKKSHSSMHGSPVESVEFKMNFSAPPKR
ncbi:hypothetical protein MKZ38_007050 [Zalerion maritima]|uniref:LPXTG-domain-containing protein n=1 Tax=Zalerion maritima TaxID=339359 RepID=A0AAD5WTT8_9PEZI|nr:hypothetical protein MKZ38_007050 [Zalerion maritima]